LYTSTVVAPGASDAAEGGFFTGVADFFAVDFGAAGA
jgi:hypothetical protein